MATSSQLSSCLLPAHAGAKAWAFRDVLKREDLQRIFSFKIRGAFNKMCALSAAERARGVVCASAGNHAQGVAVAAAHLGVRATIVMPEATPINKVNATMRFGGKVVLHGASYDEAFEEAKRIEASENRVFVHAFNDEQVMAGQGTIGLELLEQNPYLDAIVVAIGGGGRDTVTGGSGRDYILGDGGRIVFHSNGNVQRVETRDDAGVFPPEARRFFAHAGLVSGDGRDPKLVVQFLGPLIDERRQREHEKFFHHAACEQFFEDEPGLDGFAEADFIGEQCAAPQRAEHTKRRAHLIFEPPNAAVRQTEEIVGLVGHPPQGRALAQRKIPEISEG
jgi:hypothetical protein